MSQTLLQQFSLQSCCGFSSQFPEDSGSEVALCGRSNAGKSTIINRLVGAKIAHVSQRPGKTQTVNFYGSGTGGRIVDLPGVGYAKASHQQIARMELLIGDYLGQRQSLRAVVHCMDIRHPWQKADRWMVEACQQLSLPWLVLLNKADKLSKNEQAKQLKAAKSLVPHVSYLTFSAKNGTNHDQLLTYLDEWLV